MWDIEKLNSFRGMLNLEPLSEAELNKIKNELNGMKNGLDKIKNLSNEPYYEFTQYLRKG